MKRDVQEDEADRSAEVSEHTGKRLHKLGWVGGLISDKNYKETEQTEKIIIKSRANSMFDGKRKVIS